MTTTTRTTTDPVEWMRQVLDDYEATAERYPYSLPDRAMRFVHVRALREEVTDSGSPFFSADTMRFFSSRVLGRLHGGRFFITSERPPYGPRAYAVRWVYEHTPGERLSVESFGGIGAFATAAQAHGFAARAAQILP